MNSTSQTFPMQHEDFGEKIGGAKKDLWKERGLYAEDLEAMNEREADKFVKKDNIWKNRQSMSSFPCSAGSAHLSWSGSRL